MQHLEKHKPDFTDLLEAGFIAAHQADEDSALKLFKAAAVLKPESVLPKVGFGYLHFLKLEIKKAIETFELVLKQDPHNDMCKALLGLAKSFNTKEYEQGETILKELLLKSEDSSVKTLALSGVEFVEKFVRKKASPINTHAPKKKGK